MYIPLGVIKGSLRILSGILFVGSIVALIAMLFSDTFAGFRPTGAHQKAGPFALMLAGASFVCLQLSGTTRAIETVKGLLLGLAFVLWGAEPFIPGAVWVTVVYSAVIVIFIVDLGLVVLERLRRK